LRFKASQFGRFYFEKPFTNIGLVEWLKVETLSSNPSTEKKKLPAQTTNLLAICGITFFCVWY
jgi:hypothetical protein